MKQLNKGDIWRGPGSVRDRKFSMETVKLVASESTMEREVGKKLYNVNKGTKR